jgi:hypothetical protein
MSVPHTKTISNKAKGLLFKPNCIGVNAKLKIRLSTKGIITSDGIFFLYTNQKTFPKEIAMMIYRIVHTGPNTHAGGAHEGLTNC